MFEKFKDIIEALPVFKQTAESLRESLLANLVMIGEIPSPTFGERERTDFLQQRFSVAGLQDISGDQMNNGLGIIGGTNRAKNILVAAHADTVFDADVDHTINIGPDRVIGAGVGDNGLGLALLATLPTIVNALDLQFESNIILMGVTRGLGRGNLEGFRFFLENNERPIQAGICVEGVQLGRLSIASLGMLRGEITCRVPDQYDWTRFGSTGAIFVLSEVINRLVAIPLPRRPRSSIVLGSVRGGKSYNKMANHALLRFEIRSESADLVKSIREQVEEIVSEAASRTGAGVELDLFARRKPGGIPNTHPLARRTRAVMKALDIPHRIKPSTSELSALIDRGIPGITLGLTTGENLNQPGEAIHLQPLSTGIAQLLGILLAIDREHCHAGS